jgi:hypothetical protein
MVMEILACAALPANSIRVVAAMRRERIYYGLQAFTETALTVAPLPPPRLNMPQLGPRFQ